MPSAPRFGQLDLALAFAKSLPVVIAVAVAAACTGHTGLERRIGTVIGRKRATAGTATRHPSGPQPVSDRNAAIEDKAFALPNALLFRHVLQILEDSTLQVKDLIDPLSKQEVR